MSREAILETYSKAATERDTALCCPVDYSQEFSQEELQHIPEEVLEFNYGCGVPPELRRVGGRKERPGPGSRLGSRLLHRRSKSGVRRASVWARHE